MVQESPYSASDPSSPVVGQPHRPPRGRRWPATLSRAVAGVATAGLLVAAMAPVASAQTPALQDTTASSGGSSSTTTAPVVTLPGASTTTTSTTAPPASTTTSTTTKAPGVPNVPTAGPPTTKPPAGAKPAPTPAPAQPDVDPILSQVDSDLAQLGAINEYKAAQALVATAQGKVTVAGAALLTARQNLQKAQYYLGVANNTKSHADTQLRQLALAAYMGVSYSGLGGAPGANGDQGQGTVSTPFGLSGMNAIDAQELLVLVGQHAKQDDDSAIQLLSNTTHQLATARAAYIGDQNAVTGAENGLINAQQTLHTVVTAATTPGAAAAGTLPPLQLDDAAQAKPAATTSTPSTTLAGITAAAVQNPAEAINGATPISPNILTSPGAGTALNAQAIQAWWATLNRQANLTVPINSLIQSYDTWGTKLGVRADIAFAQSVVETGYFSFPSYGQVTPKNNNFAGIGACDTCATGWSFPTADTGVEAQLELLREFATTNPLPAGVKNVIGSTGVGGCCQTWVQLAGKWATSTTYGIAIMTVYQSMLQWFIPQQELAAGLFSPTSATAAAAAQGPDLAPLPTPPTTTPTTTPGATTSTTVAPPRSAGQPAPGH